MEQPNVKRIIQFSPPDITELEIAEVAEALRSGWITTGKRTKLLEKRLAAFVDTGRTDIDCGTAENAERWSNRLICLNSATASETMLLRLIGVGPGDEVIVPAYTYTATASAALHCGAKVRFIDIQKDGDATTRMPEMDYDKLEAAINEKTKVIVPVDLGGIVCDYERIFDIVERKRRLFVPMNDDSTALTKLASRIQQAIGRVIVLADSAHGLGACRLFCGEWRSCGAIADFTSFSFHAVKNFTTGEGGAAAWKPVDGVDDHEIYRMLSLLSLHGQSRDALDKLNPGTWEYDIVGAFYKCNMTDVTAAIGLRQLDRYQSLLNRRTVLTVRYDAAMDALGVPHLVHHTDRMESSKHLYLVRIPGADEERRNRIIRILAENGVASNVHYKPLPMMTAYKNAEVDISDFPNSYDYYHNLISLPLHTLLSDEDVDYICGLLADAIRLTRC